jgi:lipopolysaccharide/colanic/teichoic acid biosynthesis glycosyltransferase
LIVLLPLLIGCAAWIKVVDGGPVFYYQWRAGRDGWLFHMCKFRTMRKDAESTSVRLATEGDSRVLPDCGWMRRSHVDELPQLIHVLFGQMSLVGPRPERPEIIEQIHNDLPHFSQRLVAAPGLTGLAQVRLGYSNDLDGMRQKLNCDLHYLRHRSVMGDLRVLLATIPKLWDRAAC